jgi:DNA-binding transcriptional regulator YhcF (GntR family)
LDNNFDPEEYVDNSVREYCERLDVDALATDEVHNILNDTDFINALALAIVNVRKQQAAERKAKQDQPTQGDTNASL